MSELLVQNEHPVEAWLSRTEERTSTAVLNYAKTARSSVDGYLYARMLGLDATIEQWDVYFCKRFKKLDYDSILDSEVMALMNDIAELRRLVAEGAVRATDMATKLSYLQKELRGHIDTLSSLRTQHDKRSLILFGVTETAAKLKKTLGRMPSIWPAVEAALEGAFAEIEFKNQVK